MGTQAAGPQGRPCPAALPVPQGPHGQSSAPTGTVGQQGLSPRSSLVKDHDVDAQVLSSGGVGFPDQGVRFRHWSA